MNSFIRNVQAWPRTEAEASSAAEKVRELLEVPFAAIYTPEFGVRVAFIAPNRSEVPTRPVLEEISEFLRKQVAAAGDVSPAQVKRIRLSQGSPQLSGLKLGHLALVRLVEEIRAMPLTNGSPAISEKLERKGKKDLGWLLVDAGKALSFKSELLLVAAAERLSFLGITAELAGMIAMRDQFLSIASHELKTPLTSIYGVLQLQERMLRVRKEEGSLEQAVQEYRNEREKQHSFLKIVIRQVERLNELIDALLDVSRIQNGRFIVEPTETDVATLVRDTVGARLSVIAKEASVRIMVDAPESLSAIVDPIRFEEVITNLVMNAIRFSPEGGTVWVRLQRDEGMLRLSVHDQGVSVPEEDRTRIFRPFERAKSSVRMGGLGLGLFISRQIAQLHGGDVVLLDTTLGHGNTFEARFPIEATKRLSA